MSTFHDLPADTIARIADWAGEGRFGDRRRQQDLINLALVSKAVSLHAFRKLYSFITVDPARTDVSKTLSTGPWTRHALVYLEMASEEGMFDRMKKDHSPSVRRILDVAGDQLRESDVSLVRNLDWNVLRHPSLAGASLGGAWRGAELTLLRRQA